MADQQKANELIDAAVRALLSLKDVLVEPAPVVESPIQIQSQSTPTTQVQEDNFDSFENLRRALESSRWPEAVNKNLICDPNSEKDKMERGRGIIELMIEGDLKGKKFLDFGCGEGHCAALSADYQTEASVGYDIAARDSWEQFKDKAFFTTNFEEAAQKGPYDIIVMFDVLDHLKLEDPIRILSKVRQVLADTGKVYMRCHPFVSRHATHLYHDLNKAYLHLVFTPEELKELVPNSVFEEPNLGVVFPQKTYEDFVSKAGLKIKDKRITSEKLEPFFKIPKIAERIMKITKTDKFPDFQLGMQFIDYVLTK